MSEIPNQPNPPYNQPPGYNQSQQVPPGGYQQPPPQGGYQNFPPPPQYGFSGVQEKLPNSGGILALGILGIVLAGGIGLILSIIALAMAPGAIRLYEQYPGRFTESSLKNVKAGRTCAIIGICLLVLIIFLVVAANA
jgi:hypothetical protein